MPDISKSDERESLAKMRHSAAHLLAVAVKILYPKAKLGIGPSIENGFYYDFDFPEKISEADLPKIEAKMEEIKKLRLPFEKLAFPVEEAQKLFKEEPFKLELIEGLAQQGEKEVSIYKTGDFADLCKGPHIKDTSDIGPCKLTSIAGAYWKGSEKNKMLTRIYGTCFTEEQDLKEHLKNLEEAKERDHRKLNQVLDLYFISEDLGRGLVTLLPNGTLIAQELEKWAVETEEKGGYTRVLTPHIANEKVFRTSGHVPYYKESMFPPMRMEEKSDEETDVYYLKPMNCAGHCLVFKAKPRSYRDLPLRIAEYGAVYRYEQSGELHGMLRVRGPIHQNDAHIFCTEEQAEDEFKKVMEMHEYYYRTLGLTDKDYYLSFATRDKSNKEKFLGSDALWEKAERITLDYIKKTGLPYEIEEGGAAFYGPKIDFNIRTVTGKVFSASTNQLDFFLPQSFDLKYTDKDGTEKTPVCIHRAPLGAHVRFIAFLTEHFNGAFPVWLAPTQVEIIPISEKNSSYAQHILSSFKEEGIRARLGKSDETLEARIRQAEMTKVPYMIIVGEKEEKKNTISLRARSRKDLGVFPVDKAKEKILAKIKDKALSIDLD